MENLVTIPQIAEEYGVTRQAIISIKHRNKDTFPKPKIVIGTGGAYDKFEIFAFLRSIDWVDEDGVRGAGVGRGITPEQVTTIIDTFSTTGSIKKAAEAAKVSEPTARKHLIKGHYIKCNCPCHEV